MVAVVIATVVSLKNVLKTNVRAHVSQVNVALMQSAKQSIMQHYVDVHLIILEIQRSYVERVCILRKPFY